VLLLYLGIHRGNSLAMHCGRFRRQRLSSDASRTVVADPAVGVVIDGAVIDVDVDVGDVHVVDRAVVVEAPSAPVPALITGAAVTESIVNAAVVADILPPRAVVITIPAVVIAPITGGPQVAHFRRLRPSAGDPVVALGGVAPISRRP
jgi:hypothetical protein